MRLNHSVSPVPGPCDPEDLIDGIIFAANYLGSTQLLSDKTPSKNIRMMQAQEAVSRIKVKAHSTRTHTLLFSQSSFLYFKVRQLLFGFEIYDYVSTSLPLWVMPLHISNFF